MRYSDSDAPRSEESAESHSGLHEIKALARSARRQLSKRRSASETETERDQALLASASSPGLRAAVMPRSGTAPGRPRAFAAGTDAAAIMPVRKPTEERGRAFPTWMVAVVGAALVTAVAVFVAFKMAGDHAPAQVATAPAVSSEPVVSALTPPAEAAATPEPALAIAGSNDETAVADDLHVHQEQPPQAADDVYIHQKQPSEAADDVYIHQKQPREADDDVRVHRSTKRTAVERRTRKPQAEVKPREKEAVASAPPAPASDEQDGEVAEMALEELLNGGTSSAPSAAAALAPEAPAVPEKKTLTKSDVSKALRKISGRVAKCEQPDGLSANVMVRFTVAPEGRVSAAQAIGEHAGKSSGQCVARAVKSARFPATSGRPMSFTLPFFLTP